MPEFFARTAFATTSEVLFRAGSGFTHTRKRMVFILGDFISAKASVSAPAEL
jgi:hypothetical protein